jgi:hypothetical protein
MNLMSFPSLPQVLWYCGPFLFSGPVVLLVSAGLWFLYLRQVFRSVRARLREPGHAAGRAGGVAPLGFAAVVALLIGVVHFCATYSILHNALWWHIEPERIAEIEVEQMPKEGEPPVGPPVMISDRAALRDGFARLADAEAYQRNHESFLDGYRLRIREVGAANFSERYLTVYRQSKRRGAVPLVIPHRGPDDDGAQDEGGEYTSPAFLKWVAEVIDPHFADRGR